MKDYIPNRELEELGNGLVSSFIKWSGMRHAPKCIDIVGVAEFLGLNVVYEHFAEDEPDKIGFLSDGKTPLKVRRNGKVVSFPFPLGTIVLDTVLRADAESGRRRFTIAHEIAHYVICKHNPVPQFHQIYDTTRNYTAEEMKRHLTVEGMQADRLAAVILMPEATVKKALLDFHRGYPVAVYGQNIIQGDDRKTIHRMAGCLGVSFTALFIRLKELGLLDYRPISEDVDTALRGGALPWV